MGDGILVGADLVFATTIVAAVGLSLGSSLAEIYEVQFMASFKNTTKEYCEGAHGESGLNSLRSVGDSASMVRDGDVNSPPFVS